MARETWIYDPAVKRVVTKGEYSSRERPNQRKFDWKPTKVERGSWVLDPLTLKLVPRSEYSGPAQSRLSIIRDLQPYKPVAADKQSGKRDVIGGRRQHREFLQRNGYIEVGNEKLTPRTQLGPRPGEVAAAVKRALGE